MSSTTINIILGVWGIMLGPLIGQFANRVMTAYSGSFTRNGLQTAFAIGLVLALGWHVWLIFIAGASFVEAALGTVVYTVAIGTAVTAGRLVWSIVSDAAKNAWNLAKSWVKDLWTEAKWRVTGEVDYVRPNIHIHKAG